MQFELKCALVGTDLNSLFFFCGHLFLFFLVWLLIYVCVEFGFIVWSIYIPFPCSSESWQRVEFVRHVFRSESCYWTAFIYCFVAPFFFLPEFWVLLLKCCQDNPVYIFIFLRRQKLVLWTKFIHKKICKLVVKSHPQVTPFTLFLCCYIAWNVSERKV